MSHLLNYSVRLDVKLLRHFEKRVTPLFVLLSILKGRTIEVNCCDKTQHSVINRKPTFLKGHHSNEFTSFKNNEIDHCPPFLHPLP